MKLLLGIDYGTGGCKVTAIGGGSPGARGEGGPRTGSAPGAGRSRAARVGNRPGALRTSRDPKSSAADIERDRVSSLLQNAGFYVVA